MQSNRSSTAKELNKGSEGLFLSIYKSKVGLAAITAVLSAVLTKQFTTGGYRADPATCPEFDRGLPAAAVSPPQTRPRPSNHGPQRIARSTLRQGPKTTL